MDERIFIDSEPCKHARRYITTRTLSRPRRHVYVELNRDSYVDCWPELGAAVHLSPAFLAAVERCREAGQLRLWISNGVNAPAGASERFITLAIPEAYRDEAVEALRAAELEARLEPLETLTTKLAVPIEEWLTPGHHLFRRGVDFTCSTSQFLFLLRTDADKRRDRRIVSQVNGDIVTVDITAETSLQWLLRNRRRRSRRR